MDPLDVTSLIDVGSLAIVASAVFEAVLAGEGDTVPAARHGLVAKPSSGLFAPAGFQFVQSDQYFVTHSL